MEYINLKIQHPVKSNFHLGVMKIAISFKITDKIPYTGTAHISVTNTDKIFILSSSVAIKISAF
jgi:hypothetical protein